MLINEINPRALEELEVLQQEIGDRIARTFGFALYDLAFVRRGTLQKTSSGKVQRTKLRGQYEDQTLEILWQQRSTSEDPT